jgi:hypothetical protein
MRAFAFGLITALGFAAALHGVSAAPSPLRPAAIAADALAVPVAHHCGKGHRWVPSGYVRGRYRAGHCAPA